MTPELEEMQIEVERLKAWLNKIKNEAWKETPVVNIERMAEDAIKHGSCAAQPQWGSTQDWAKLGLWPTTPDA